MPCYDVRHYNHSDLLTYTSGRILTSCARGTKVTSGAFALEWRGTQDCTNPVILARIGMTDVSNCQNTVTTKSVLQTTFNVYTGPHCDCFQFLAKGPNREVLWHDQLSIGPYVHLPSVQTTPASPAGQRQVNLSAPLTHVPPLWHGKLAHSSVSGKVRAAGGGRETSIHYHTLACVTSWHHEEVGYVSRSRNEVCLPTSQSVPENPGWQPQK